CIFSVQLSLEYWNGHMCGAVIISENWAVTAAHCLDGVSVDSISFRAGSSIRGSGGSVHAASVLIQHPNYNSHTMDCDIAVVKVSTPFSFGVGVQPISLTSSEPSTGETGVVSGWGSTFPGGSVPFELQVVSVHIVDHAECVQDYDFFGNVTGNMICAGEEEGGKDACGADSGGPLTVNGKLVGIISWGVGCGERFRPKVYANIATLKDFITEQTGVN
ncbi:hypothetical protein ANN_03185, partial [Periplaneta americana]